MPKATWLVNEQDDFQKDTSAVGKAFQAEGTARAKVWGREHAWHSQGMEGSGWCGWRRGRQGEVVADELREEMGASDEVSWTLTI